MLQLTAVAVVFVTVAVNVAWFPSTTDAFVGFTLTCIVGGGGGGGDDDTLPAVQPIVHAPSTRSATNPNVLVLDLFPLLRGRDHRPSEEQAKGQRRGRG